jgi:L-ascorbate metabolism protein UlaG (beta-lactamase superfamily)
VEEQDSAAFLRRIDALDVKPGMLALGALGQSGFAIKAGHTVVYIDPYLTDAIEDGGGPARAIPIVVEPAHITNAAAVICTHEHADHTDPGSVLPILMASPDAPVLASLQGRDLLL